MLQFLGRLLAADRHNPPQVRYLSKAESEPVWRDGKLLAVDPQGATFATVIDQASVAECLPWGSISAIRARLADDE
jgi:hypothetical protein